MVLLGVTPAALRSRRVGTALTWFGVVGLVLSVAMTISLLTGLGALDDLDRRLDDNRLAMASALGQGIVLLDATADTMESTTSSLESVRATVDDTAQLLDQLETSTRELVSALGVNILGQRPFASVARSFEEIADQLAISADDAATVVQEIDNLEPDLAQVADDLRAVRASVSVLAARTTDFEDLGNLIGLLRLFAILWALVSLWLAALAGGCIWLGRQFRLERSADLLTP
jgi:methyl-accepting chemotaxis protein